MILESNDKDQSSIKIMFISIRWEAILWVVTDFFRLGKTLRPSFCKLLALGGPRLCIEETK